MNRTAHIIRIMVGILACLAMSACAVNYEVRTRTTFQPWPGRMPDATQLRPGDVILRMMDSPQAVVLAGLGRGHFSHCGVIFLRDGEPWVADCLGLTPRPAVKAEPLAEFLAGKHHTNRFHVSRLGPLPAHHTFDVDFDEQVVHYLVLRHRQPLDPERFNQVLAEYLHYPTQYDFDYRLDNDRPGLRSYYCTEFVWRFLADVTGDDLSLPRQTMADTLANVALVERMVFQPEVMDSLKRRYGDKFVNFMLEMGEKDKRTLASLPHSAAMIAPEAFLLSPSFDLILYQASPDLREECAPFFHHFLSYLNRIATRNAAERLAGGDAPDTLASSDLSADDSAISLNYMKTFLVRSAPPVPDRKTIQAGLVDPRLKP